MLENEKNDFFISLKGLMEIYNKKPEASTYKLWWAILSEYDSNVVTKAFTDYAKNEKYPPVPAGVIDYMPKPKQISADEAWAHVPKSELEGAWLNQRMSNALGQVAGMNDMIAARKSFIAAYNNLDDDNEWFYSPANGMGYDQQQETKEYTRNQLEAKKWISEKKRKESPMIENGLSKTQLELNKSRVSELLLTIQEDISRDQTNDENQKEVK